MTAREIRLQQHMSLRLLEARTGVNRATWSQIERGLLLPSPAQLAKLSEALGVPYREWRIRFMLERGEGV